MWFEGMCRFFWDHFHKPKMWVLLSGLGPLAKPRVYKGGHMPTIFTQMETYSSCSMLMTF